MSLSNYPLSSETIQMIVASVTHSGSSSLSEIEAERLLNVITRAQSMTPTERTPSSDIESK